MTSSKKFEIRNSKFEISEKPVVKIDFKTQLKNFFNIFFAFLTVGGDLA